MNDALLMRRFEGFGDLLRNRQRFVERHGSLSDTIRECRTVNQLHHERWSARRVLEAVNVGDVRVIQRGKQVGFPLEPRKSLGIVSKRVGQDFERDITPELCVAGPVHLL